MMQAVRPPSGISYIPQQRPPAQQQQQHPQSLPGGNDPYARLHWLESQHQALFKDNAWLFNDNVRLNNERTPLMQQLERLQRENAGLQAEKQQLVANAGPSQQSHKLLEEQNQKLLAENRRLTEEKNKITQENRELRKKQPAVNPEEYIALIKKLKEKITALKKKADEDSIVWESCGNCDRGHGIKHTLCSGCFMPAHDSMGRGRKGSTRINYTSVSDSDDGEGKLYDRSHYYEDLNTKIHTRLDQDLFDWLQDWCVENSDKIEVLRAQEREKNKPTVRALVEDLRDAEAEIRKTYKSLAGQKRKKRKLKRKLIVLTDETPVVTDDETVLKKKLYTFCHIISQPQGEYDASRFPCLVGNKLLTEREAVKIFHQILTPMRLLHHDLITKPSQSDKKFKPRKQNPNQWKILLGPGRDSHGSRMHSFFERGDQEQGDRIEETWVSSVEQVGTAAAALQNLIFEWNEGLVG